MNLGEISNLFMYFDNNKTAPYITNPNIYNLQFKMFLFIKKHKQSLYHYLIL